MAANSPKVTNCLLGTGDSLAFIAMEQNANSLEILLKHWSQEDLHTLPPYGESIVRSTFLELGVDPPKDLIRLYSAIGGMEVPDKNLWRLWPLSEVYGHRDETNEFGMLFSDYLLDSWVYRLKPIDKDSTAVYVDYFDGRDAILIAETLDQFFDKYLQNADELLNDRTCLDRE